MRGVYPSCPPDGSLGGNRKERDKFGINLETEFSNTIFYVFVVLEIVLNAVPRAASSDPVPGFK